MNKPASVQISTYWWDEALQKDIPSNCCEVTIWTHIGSVGKSYHHTCCTPQELWDYMHELNTDIDKVLKEEFGFVPTSRSALLPVDLKELFK